MKIIFDFEGRMENEAFFALYAGLRMYKEQKNKQIRLLNESKPENERTFSIPAAEAYCMLQDMKEQYPVLYQQAGVEYQEVYGSPDKN